MTARKSKAKAKSGSAKRRVASLPATKTRNVKGGASAHEMKKALIGNLPR